MLPSAWSWQRGSSQAGCEPGGAGCRPRTAPRCDVQEKENSLGPSTLSLAGHQFPSCWLSQQAPSICVFPYIQACCQAAGDESRAARRIYLGARQRSASSPLPHADTLQREGKKAQNPMKSVLCTIPPRPCSAQRCPLALFAAGPSPCVVWGCLCVVVSFQAGWTGRSPSRSSGVPRCRHFLIPSPSPLCRLPRALFIACCAKNKSPGRSVP